MVAGPTGQAGPRVPKTAMAASRPGGAHALSPPPCEGDRTVMATNRSGGCATRKTVMVSFNVCADLGIWLRV
jgi:hypothetical protein